MIQENKNKHGDTEQNKAFYRPFGKPFKAWVTVVDIKPCAVRRDQPKHIRYKKQYHVILLGVLRDMLQGEHKHKINDVQQNEVHTNKEKPEQIDIAIIHE
jgi:hypothetical protein